MDPNGLQNQLAVLNQIGEALNRAVDVQSALAFALESLVKAMGLETGWIFLKDEADQDLWAGRGYKLAAHLNLPPALSLDKEEPWRGGCDCQGFCNLGKLTDAYNEVRCTRLADSQGERRKLAVHASAPLGSGETTLGILNVAAPDWAAFTPESLALLTNVGAQMGVALERARLYDLLRARRIDEQRALLAISNQLLHYLNLGEVADYLVEQLPKLLRIDACALLLPGSQEGTLVAAAASGWKEISPDTTWEVSAGQINILASVWHDQRLHALNGLGETGAPPQEIKPLLREGFKSAVLVPLLVEERPVGMMLLAHRGPWKMDENERRFLRLIGNQAAIAIEKARLHQADLAQQRLENELALSRQIQGSMLPQEFPEQPGWEFAVHYQPARQVGGDFFDHFDLSGLPEGADCIGLVIADVADKGLPAALFMALSRTVIRNTALATFSPAQVLESANRMILRDSRESLFLSVFYACLNTRNGHMVYSRAGHPPPFLVRAEGPVEPLSTPGVVLGVLEDISLEEDEVALQPGESVLFYTDGVTEAMDSNGTPFGEDRLMAALIDRAGMSAQAIVERVVRAVSEFTQGADQSDDMTLMVVQKR